MLSLGFPPFPLPKLGNLLDVRPRLPNPPNYAPIKAPNHCFWSGKPEESFLRTPFGRKFACFLVPHPGTPRQKVNMQGCSDMSNSKGPAEFHWGKNSNLHG
eukprot:1157669-Pelagomonas_calceolata.AAC.6